MVSIEKISEELRERFRHEARVNTPRLLWHAEKDEGAYTPGDRAGWEASQGAER